MRVHCVIPRISVTADIDGTILPRSIDYSQRNIIHRNTRLSEAPSHGETIIMHDAASKGAVNYLNFAREILQKNDLTRISNDDKLIEIDEQ